MLTQLLSLFGAMTFVRLASGRSETPRTPDKVHDAPSHAQDKLVAKKVAAEKATTEEAIVEKATAEEAIVEKATAEEAIVEKATAEEAIVEKATAEEAIVEKATAEEAIVEKATAEEAIVEKATAEKEATNATHKAAASSGTSTKKSNTADENDLNRAIDLESSIKVAGGKVTTLLPNDYSKVDSIEILSGPKVGSLTVNPDNSLAMVLSRDPDFNGKLEFKYKVTYDNGQTETLTTKVDVKESEQQSGWGQGDVYMLATDKNGDVIVETGENHRDVYISGNKNALSLQDIASREGMNINDIDAEWLANNPEYGATESMALDTEAGLMLWQEITGVDAKASSNWLHFERGYEYDNLGKLIASGTTGESELNPIHVTAYGEGEKPILNTKVTLIKDLSSNIVFSDLSITGGVLMLETENILFDNTDISMIDGDGNTGFSVRDSNGFTLHNSSITDVYRTKQLESSGEEWVNHMSSGLLVVNTGNVLIENSFFDHNGWAPDYREDLSIKGGQVPTKFNHNIYTALDVNDLTIRDNIIMRGSSIGAKVMDGAHFEDNVMVDNHIGSSINGGTSANGVQTGSFTYYSGNVVTSAGHKDNDSGDIGALSRGADFKGTDATLIDNIITHLADPDNAQEFAAKDNSNHALISHNTPVYDDTIIYNWTGSDGHAKEAAYKLSEDRNVDGLKQSDLDQTTIQNIASDILNKKNATIDDLAEKLRAEAADNSVDTIDADRIIEYFRDGFGLDTGERTSAATVRFTPNDLADGIRWDNKLNWSTEDLPGGLNSSDSVDLAGNWVNYGGTTTIRNLDFGDGGSLQLGNGKLTVNGKISAEGDGGEVNIHSAGQLWVNGNSARDLELTISGGRFANTGDMSGTTEMTISGGQAILATKTANYDIGKDSTLHIEGSDAQVGFDGTGQNTTVLRLSEDGLLKLTADKGGFSAISEFKSGAFGDSPSVASGVNLGLGSLELDLTSFSSNGTYDLIDVDEIVGEFSDVNINGLGSKQDASVVVDYVNDTVTLELAKGSGNLDMSYIGTETNTGKSAALWKALTDGQGTYSDEKPTELLLDDDLIGYSL